MIKSNNHLDNFKIFIIIVLVLLIAASWIYLYFLEKKDQDLSNQENIILKSKIQEMEDKLNSLASTDNNPKNDNENNQQDSEDEQIGNKININTASSEELQTLSGIGPAKASDVISYRENNDFQAIEEIQNVKGIGPATFEKIKNQITVE